MTNEGLIDKRIDQFVEWEDGSQTYVKYTAIAAGQVVGMYDGATEELVKRTKRSTSTIQNRAHAFNLYKELRKDNRAIARELWRSLPISFWVGADRIQKAGYESIKYLLSAYRHGWSVRDMNMEFDRDREAGNAPLQYERVKLTAVGLANEIMRSNHTSARLRNATHAWLLALEAE